MTAINASDKAYNKVKNEMARLQSQSGSNRRITMAKALDSLLEGDIK